MESIVWGVKGQTNQGGRGHRCRAARGTESGPTSLSTPFFTCQSMTLWPRSQPHPPWPPAAPLTLPQQSFSPSAEAQSHSYQLHASTRASLPHPAHARPQLSLPLKHPQRAFSWACELRSPSQSPAGPNVSPSPRSP
jgi:hypothetical protein